MGLKLGTLLLRDAVISLTQLQEALKAQVLYGGRLGTNLVELGYLEVDHLSTYLAKIREVPEATAYLLERAPNDVVNRLPAEIATKYLAIPFSASPGGPVSVAFVDPNDPQARAGVEEAIGAKVEAFIAPQLRVLYYLERMYDQPREARFLRPTSTIQPGPAGERRRYRTTPAGGYAPRPRKRSNTNVGTPTLSYQHACVQIDQSSNRDGIAQTLLRYAQGRVPLLALFSRQDDVALGWCLFRGGEASVSQEELKELAIPVGGLSSFGRVLRERLPFRGPVDKEQAMESRLWRALDAPAPNEVLVVPLMVQGEVVGFLYTQSEAPLGDLIVSELVELGVRASTALASLVGEQVEQPVQT